MFLNDPVVNLPSLDTIPGASRLVAVARVHDCSRNAHEERTPPYGRGIQMRILVMWARKLGDMLAQRKIDEVRRLTLNSDC